MAVNNNTSVVLLPFSVRPGFGSPYPLGVAVGHIDVTGDLSGGAAGGTLLAPGGFLYRLELLNSTMGFSGSAVDMSFITSHRWATDRSGRGIAAFDLNWHAETENKSGFLVATPRPSDYQMIRRFPMGRTDNVAAQVLSAITWITNIDTALYDFDWVFTYWRKEATYLPGFMAAFLEAPFVPPLDVVVR